MNRYFTFALLIACGRDVTESDYKLAGVGLNPDEIGPTPKMYGGMISYDFIEFSGGALPLALVGLSAYDGTGPSMSTFKPPYGMVTGTSFFFEMDMPVPDVLFGSVAVPPENIGTCQTVFEPQSYLSGIADAGSSVSLRTIEGAGMDLGRRPLFYPPDQSGVFPYYMELAVYKESERFWRDPATLDDLDTWETSVAARSNYPFGQAVEVSFPGAVTDKSATFGSIPVPFSSLNENASHQLPVRPSGVMLSWAGPVYSTDGILVDSNDTLRNTCMQFQAHGEDPEAVSDCLEYADLPDPIGDYFPKGQMYTAPWDTTDGKVSIQWIPQTINPNESVSISVRFLGEVDESDRSFVEEVVAVPKSPNAESAWGRAISSGTIPDGTECPAEGTRPAMPCDEDVDFVFDDMLRKGDGYVSSLQGDPSKALVEVTCRVDDAQGNFEITTELLADAMSYAKQHNARGAVFYINRTTTSEFTTPNVRDRVGNLRESGPLLVTSNAVQFGRFWFNDGALDGE
jgi:hypothetical protein